jgi:hypothetical protein
MKNSSRKVLALISVFVIGLTWGAVALASNYQTTFLFEHQLTGPTRFFNGQNIIFEATPRTYPSVPGAKAADSIYTATLIRYNGWLNKDKIGTVVLPRNSWGKAVWTNVGPGNYYLFFDKTIDHMYVSDENALMYND